MPISVSSTNQVLTSERDASLAKGVLETLGHPDGFLSVADTERDSAPLPRDLGVLLQNVLESVARGGTVTITSIPDDLTTSAAASLLGISRPTLMKMIGEGALPSHKAGTHTRVKSEDVMALQRARRARERAAFERLRDVEDELQEE